MKNLFLVSFLACFSLVSNARQPSTPYFSNFDMFELLPYSEDQLSYFKENGVSQIEIKQDDSFKEVQYFNELNQLSKIEYYNISKKKDKLLGEVKFLYNKKGQVVRKLRNENAFFTIDSLAYDDKGIIDYYSLTEKMDFKKISYNEKTIEYKFSHFDSSGYKVLTETYGDSELDFQVFLDSNNIIQKDITHRGTDSLSILSSKSDTLNEVIYLKHFSNNFEIRKGSEEIYYNELLIRKNIYQVDSDKERLDFSVFYYYDNLNRLIKSENDHFYTKNEYLYSYERNTSLISEKFWIIGKKMYIEKYSYTFH